MAGALAMQLFNHQPRLTQTPVPAPVATPAPQPTPLVLRAQRVVPKAQLVALPNWPIGQAIDVTMPYGDVVHARYLGRVNNGALPLYGNQLGDMRVAGTTEWIWTVAPGVNAPQWVDP